MTMGATVDDESTAGQGTGDGSTRPENTRKKSGATMERILEAARECLLTDGFSGLSTRKVATVADVPLSQIHYHFGGKHGLVLAVLTHENRRLLARQKRMYSADTPLWQRYDQACDLLEEDLESGYVRVLQEMIAAGWSDRELAGQVLTMLRSWLDVLQQVAREAQARLAPAAPFPAADIAGLIGLAFLGGEVILLLDDPQWNREVRTQLRSLTGLIRTLEEAALGQGHLEET
ncbi:TetR/AcrR family transcriptional regulator [Streptosporangiaceae bacterium NEAU-GS5]|nr:TetR/AcrR family transcriptional regulator [Streptosporangiaceae bacterium NEAU-GS5]